MKTIFIFLLIFCESKELHSYMECYSTPDQISGDRDCYLTVGLDHDQSIEISGFRITCGEERRLLLQLPTGLDDLPQVPRSFVHLFLLLIINNFPYPQILWKMNLVERPGLFDFGFSQDENNSYIVIKIDETN